jgi:hypothetical protein
MVLCSEGHQTRPTVAVPRQTRRLTYTNPRAGSARTAFVLLRYAKGRLFAPARPARLLLYENETAPLGAKAQVARSAVI